MKPNDMIPGRKYTITLTGYAAKSQIHDNRMVLRSPPNDHIILGVADLERLDIVSITELAPEPRPIKVGDVLVGTASRTKFTIEFIKGGHTAYTNESGILHTSFLGEWAAPGRYTHLDGAPIKAGV